MAQVLACTREVVKLEGNNKEDFWTLRPVSCKLSEEQVQPEFSAKDLCAKSFTLKNEFGDPKEFSPKIEFVPKFDFSYKTDTSYKTNYLKKSFSSTSDYQHELSSNSPKKVYTSKQVFSSLPSNQAKVYKVESHKMAAKAFSEFLMEKSTVSPLLTPSANNSPVSSGSSPIPDQKPDSTVFMSDVGFVLSDSLDLLSPVSDPTNSPPEYKPACMYEAMKFSKCLEAAQQSGGYHEYAAYQNEPTFNNNNIINSLNYEYFNQYQGNSYQNEVCISVLPNIFK